MQWESHSKHFTSICCWVAAFLSLSAEAVKHNGAFHRPFAYNRNKWSQISRNNAAGYGGQIKSQRRSDWLQSDFFPQSPFANNNSPSFFPPPSLSFHNQQQHWRQRKRLQQQQRRRRQLHRQQQQKKKRLQTTAVAKLPEPEFFGNFAMPFLSYEEVFIREKGDKDQYAVNANATEIDLAHSPSSVLARSVPAKVIREFDRLILNSEGNSSQIEERLDDDGGQKIFSLYRITSEDGTTVIDKGDDNTEVVYDRHGVPTEVIVYLDETDPMQVGESRMQNHAQKHRNNRHAYTEGGRRRSGLDTYDEEPVEYEDYEYDEGYYSLEDDDEVIARSGGHFSSHSSSSSYGHQDEHDHGYVPQKKPGPYGYGKPNYKCEYAKETLYVTRTDYKFSKKCFKILKVQCKTKYDVGKKIGYKKLCNEFSVTKCRTVYATKFKTKCWLVYKKRCEDIYKTKVDWVYKEKCSTTYEKECSGHGYHKQCHDVPKEVCKQVPEKVEKQVKAVKCKKVPDKKCKDVPFFVPKKECKDFPRTVCVQDPINVKKDIPKKVCFTVPIEKCVKVPREVLVHVPKTVKKKICVSTKAHDDFAATSYHEDHSGGDDHHLGYGGGHSGNIDHTSGYDSHGGRTFSSYGNDFSSKEGQLAQHKVLPGGGIPLLPPDALEVADDEDEENQSLYETEAEQERILLSMMGYDVNKETPVKESGRKPRFSAYKSEGAKPQDHAYRKTPKPANFPPYSSFQIG